MMRTKFIRLKTWVLMRIKKKLNGIIVRFNTNIKIYMGLKIKII